MILVMSLCLITDPTICIDTTILFKDLSYKQCSEYAKSELLAELLSKSNIKIEKWECNSNSNPKINIKGKTETAEDCKR